MAFGMAKWAKANWQVHTREDLDDYTYYVAGWLVQCYQSFGRGVQTFKQIVSWQLAMGVGYKRQYITQSTRGYERTRREFVPDGWTRDDLFAYAEENLAKADLYMKDINKRTVLLFCRLPLALAHKTLKAMQDAVKR